MGREAEGAGLKEGRPAVGEEAEGLVAVLLLGDPQEKGEEEGEEPNQGRVGVEEEEEPNQGPEVVEVEGVGRPIHERPKLNRRCPCPARRCPPRPSGLRSPGL